MTYIYEKCSASDMIDRFKAYGRQDNFSYDGLRALHAYLEEMAESTEKPIELDVVALCCEYAEYENLAAFQEEYSDFESMDDIEANTTVIRIDDERFIIQSF